MRARSLLAVAAAVGLGGGCAGTGVDPEAAEADRRRALGELTARHGEERAQLEREVAHLRDGLEAQGREIERGRAELVAARRSRAALEASLAAALERIAAREAELAEARAQVASAAEAPADAGAGPGALDEVQPLLQAQRKEINALRAALVEARAGERPAPDPTLEGIVTPSSLDLQRPVALIDGAPVTRREFVEFLYRDLAAPKLLELYVNRRLILREARRRGLDASEVDAEVWVSRQVLAQVHATGSEEALAARLLERGYTRAAWEARLRFQAQPAVLLERLVALDRASASGARAFEDRLEAAYQDTYGERVAARHILVRLDDEASREEERAALAKAQAIRRELARAPFEEVAARRSDDPETAHVGGVLGTFDRRRFAAVDRLNTAFFTLEPGTVSEPIRSPIGYHLALVDRREPPARPYDARVRRELIARLEEEPPSEEEVQTLLERLTSRARIEASLEFD